MSSSLSSRSCYNSRSICYSLVYHSCFSSVDVCSASFAWLSSSKTYSVRSFTFCESYLTSASYFYLTSLPALCDSTFYSLISWISWRSFSSYWFVFWVKCSIYCMKRAFCLSNSDSEAYWRREVSFCFSSDWFMRSVISCFSRRSSLRI